MKLIWILKNGQYQELYRIVFDKALLDTVLCAENALPIVDKMINEIYRVMVNGGYYIVISNGNEETRKNLFNPEMWEYKMLEIEKPSKVVVLDEKDPKNYHYIYILTKIVKEEEKKIITQEKKKEEKKQIIQKKKRKEKKKKKTKKEEKKKEVPKKEKKKKKYIKRKEKKKKKKKRKKKRKKRGNN